MAVLISGRGTTLASLLAQIADGRLDARVLTVVSSSAKAPGLEIARQAGVQSLAIQPGQFATLEEFSDAVFQACRSVDPHIVAMAGFLRLVRIPRDFENRVVNIHPALIPSFCGKGLYGLKVHEEVLKYGAKITGCTVHFVDNEYDHGPIILQRAVAVEDDDTLEALAQRVFAVECEAYPEALRLIAAGCVRVEGRRVRIVRDTV